jgi:alanyl-tRNA synthetase
MISSDIRKHFLDFFAARDHRIVRSSSLVPANDPTLLFTNAGMNQFKDVFLGRERRDFVRACSSQKCVRAGGKHNDLEQVGRTSRHHTFFEMLGNFSFGDYFKKQAIPWAWELVTRDFAIPPSKLYATVFREDDEAEEIWAKDVGVPRDRIFRFDEKDNFWAMGETGPCGPCSEIHYDLGPAASDLGHKDCEFPCDCGRYVELWNLVFMQFNRDEQGNMTSLPRPSIDTGAGLERFATVLQGKISNFDTDLFRPLIEEAANLANAEYGTNHDTDVSLRIIADHSRAAAFLISDGVLPSNEGRGYVLRLILRRALYHGQTLGLNEPFMFKLAGQVIDQMKSAYPELVETEHHVAKAIKIEEERYARTTREGLERLQETPVVVPVTDNKAVEIPFHKLKEHWSEFGGRLPDPSEAPLVYSLYPPSGRPTPPPGAKVIPGDEVFKLHDTFGLRPDFVESIVGSLDIHGLVLDRESYEEEMQKQRERARASWKAAEKKVAQPVYRELGEKQKTVFDGYAQTTSENCRVLALVSKGEPLNEAKPGAEVEVVLEHTPFYAEAGGQVGDVGHILAADTDQEVAHVSDTYYPVSGLIVHRVKVRGEGLRVGDTVTAVVDAERRGAIRRAHTATHLLHAALRKTLGTHVKQAGSLVAPDGLRFDFTHYARVDKQDLLDIEDLVNEHILKNEEVVTTAMDLDAAVNTGAMALFGEKYADKVRVLTIDDFSKELCGGTHVRRTGDIGLFKVTYEASVAAGTRRIQAATGTSVIDYIRRLLDDIGQMNEARRESEKKLRKQLESQHMKQAASQAGDLLEQAKDVKGVRLISARVDAPDRAAMRQMVDSLRPRLGSGVIVLGSEANGNVALVAAVSKDLTSKLDAGKIVKAAAVIVEGSGGGRKDLAEAGGKNPAKLDESLQAIPGIVEKML